MTIRKLGESALTLADSVACQYSRLRNDHLRCLGISAAMQAKDLYIQTASEGSALSTDDSQRLQHETRSLQIDFREAPGNIAYDESEVSKFSAMAADWWNPRGSMAPLHSMNPTRVKFCRQALSDHFRRGPTDPSPLKGLKIADIGSGGGLLSESLARLGGSITGIDASREAVLAAQLHAQGDESISGLLNYQHGTAETLEAQDATFQAVVASEVIEHVPDPEGFCKALAGLSRSDSRADSTARGMVIISTLNRTPRSYALAVIAAERLLRLLPVGTHDWDKFITPEELVMLMEGNGMELDRIQGMNFNPFRQTWSMTSDLAVNYIAAFRHKI